MLPGERLRRRYRLRDTFDTSIDDPADDVEAIMLQEAREEVVSADQKASVILAVLGIGLGITLSGIIEGAWNPSDLAPWALVAWWAGVVAGALATYFAGSAVWPRYRRSDVTDGIRYWGHVAEFATLSAVEDALKDSPVSVAERTRHQLWRLSHVVARKYLSVRRSMALAASAVLLLSAASIFG
jgi:hypothetical protein